MENNPAIPDKRAWRRQMRERRRSVPPPERQALGHMLAMRLIQWPLLPRGGSLRR